MPKRQPIVQPVLLAVALALGAGAVWAVAVGWGMMVGEQLLQGERVYQSLQFQLDGTPLVHTRTGGYYSVETYHTLDGKEVPAEEVRGGVYPAMLHAPPRAGTGLARMGWLGRILGYTDRREPPTLWYLVHSGQADGWGYFVGYDSETKMRVGYLGLGGFRTNPPPAQDRFPVDARRLGHRGNFGALTVYHGWSVREPYWYSGSRAPRPGEIPESTLHLISGDRLLEVDLQERTVREVMQSPGLVSVAIASRAISDYEPDDEEAWKRVTRNLAIRTEDGRVLITDTLSGEHRSFQVPQELRRAGFGLLELADGTAIATVYGPSEAGVRTVSAYWLDRSGEIQRRESLELRSRGGVYLAPKTRALLRALRFPAPVATSLIATVFDPRDLLDRDRASGYGEALSGSLAAWWPALALTCLLAAGLAWWCHRRQGQFAAPWTPVWLVFVFLLGAPGLLGYLLHRIWSVRLSCPACGQEVPRDRESCSSCGADFPEPEPKGIEVFAG
jgi:hypothetical protein